jgi:hypothetical protein
MSGETISPVSRDILGGLLLTALAALLAALIAMSVSDTGHSRGGGDAGNTIQQVSK